MIESQFSVIPGCILLPNPDDSLATGQDLDLRW